MLFALGEPVAFCALVVSFLLAVMLRAVAIRIAFRRLFPAGRPDPYGTSYDSSPGSSYGRGGSYAGGSLAGGGSFARGGSIAPRLREDIDPFGAVAAAIGGMGWGKMLSVDEVPRRGSSSFGSSSFGGSPSGGSSGGSSGPGGGRGRAVAVFLAGPLACIVASQLLMLTYRLLYPDNILSLLGPADVLRGIDFDLGEQVLLSIAVGLLCFGLLALIPLPPLDGFGALYHAQRGPAQSMQWMRLWFEEKNIGVLILLICSLFPFGYPFLLWILNALGLLFVRIWG